MGQENYADRRDSSRCSNKQLIDLMIFEVFLYLDDTIDNIDDNVQEFAGIYSGYG